MVELRQIRPETTAVERKPNILLLDDCRLFRRMLTHYGTRMGAQVVAASDTADLDERMLTLDRVDLACVDWHLKEGTAKRAIELIRRRCPGTPIVLLSGMTECELREIFEAVNVELFTTKPIPYPVFKTICQNGIEMGKRNRALRCIDELVQSFTALQQACFDSGQRGRSAKADQVFAGTVRHLVSESGVGGVAQFHAVGRSDFYCDQAYGAPLYWAKTMVSDVQGLFESVLADGVRILQPGEVDAGKNAFTKSIIERRILLVPYSGKAGDYVWALMKRARESFSLYDIQFAKTVLHLSLMAQTAVRHYEQTLQAAVDLDRDWQLFLEPQPAQLLSA